MTGIGLVALHLALTMMAAAVEDEQDVKLADCPAAVQKTLQAEAKGAKIEAVTKTTEDDETTFRTVVDLGGKRYGIEVDEEGTLIEVSLQVEEEEIKFFDCPAAVQKTFRAESHDSKIDRVTRDVKLGGTIYETVVAIAGKPYEIVVGEEGTLIEKTLVIEEEDVELSACPAAVQKTLHAEARGGSIGAIIRSTGIGGHVYEAEVEIEGKSYTVEVASNGTLILKALDDDD